MEDTPKRGERRLRRTFERHRLEDELWDLAYEALWPQVRRVLLTQQMEGRSPMVRESEPGSEFEMRKGA